MNVTIWKTESLRGGARNRLKKPRLEKPQVSGVLMCVNHYRRFMDLGRAYRQQQFPLPLALCLFLSSQIKRELSFIRNNKQKKRCQDPGLVKDGYCKGLIAMHEVTMTIDPQSSAPDVDPTIL
jgi:hypothetical protein